MSRRRVFRALTGAGAALVVAGGVTFGFTVSAMVAGAAPSLVVTPSTGLTAGKSVTVTGSGLDAFDGQLVAVVECGNADSSGSPLPGTGPATSDCYGAESVGTQTLLVPVASGTATTPYPVQTQNIGGNKVQCIAMPPANFPCVIAMADVNTQGMALQISAPISFGSTTTTSSTTTTTTATTTTTSGSKTIGEPVGVVVTGPSSTSSTSTTTPTTTTTSAASSTSGAGSGASGSSPTTTSTAPTSPSAAKGTLAFTGVSTGLLVAAVVGFLLLDLGYLALSVRRPPRWARQLVATKSPIPAPDELPRQ